MSVKRSCCSVSHTHAPIPTCHSHCQHTPFCACFYAVTRIWKLRKNNGKNTSLEHPRWKCGRDEGGRGRRGTSAYYYLPAESSIKYQTEKESTHTMQGFPHCSYIMVAWREGKVFRIGGYCSLFFSACSLHLLTLGFCVMLFHLQVINYDSSRGGVSVITEKGDVTTSFLLIQNADLADSGKYSCAPSNADVASVRVHVLNGKYLVTSLHTDSYTHTNTLKHQSTTHAWTHAHRHVLMYMYVHAASLSLSVRSV